MILVEDRKVFSEDEVIIVPPSKELYYKRKFLNKNYSVFTLKNFLLKVAKAETKLVSKHQNYVMMLNAYEEVKSSLGRYNDANSVAFVNQLLASYDDFLDYDLVESDGVKALKVIYQAYERRLLENDFFNERLLIKHVINNIKLDGKYVFLDVEKLSDNELLLIKKMEKNGIVTLCLDNYRDGMLNKLKELGLDVRGSNDDKTKGNNACFALLNDVEEELQFVLNDMSKKIMDGYHYQDFIIVSNDVKTYEPYLELVFDVPYTRASEKGVLSKRFINLFARIIAGDFSCGTFINLLKLNLFNVDLEMVDKIDDYVYRWDLEDANFYLPFTLNPNGDKKEFSDSDSTLLEELNDAKEDVINPLKYFLENVVNEQDVKVILRWFGTYLSEEEIDQKLFLSDEAGYEQLVNALECVNDYFEGNASVTYVLSVINGLLSVQGSQTIMTDEVSISSLEKACFEDKKFVYFIGALEDTFPLRFKLNNLITNEDVLKECLINKIKEHDDYQTYLYYKLLKNDELIFTAHKLGADLALKSPSKLVSDFKRIEERETFYSKRLLTNKLALYLSAGMISSEDLLVNDADKLVRAFNHNLDFKINKGNAKRLYGDELTCSPSSIETYAKCSFYHFCNYGLRLKVKEKNVFDHRKIGTFVHYMLENIIKNDYKEITADNLEDKIESYSLKYLSESNVVINNTTKYVIKSLGKNVGMLIKSMLKNRDVSSFEPRYFEFRISEDNVVKPLVIKLDEGALRLKGVADRLDVYEDDYNYYCIIIDYKTGEKKFRLDDCLAGLNLQMVLYLLTINEYPMELTKKSFVPAGLLYYPALIKESVVSRALNDEELEKSITERTRMDGMINHDERVIRALGDDDISKFAAVFTRGKLNDEKVFSTRDILRLFDEVKKVLKTVGNEILSGDAKVNPVGGRVNACDYCKFASVCGFDKEKDKYRKLTNYKNSEVFKMLEGDLDA